VQKFFGNKAIESFYLEPKEVQTTVKKIMLCSKFILSLAIRIKIKALVYSSNISSSNNIISGITLLREI
jgi:hypothetical protein